MTEPAPPRGWVRDLPIYLLVGASLLTALFWPSTGVPSRSFEMDEDTAPHLLSGWSEPERHGALSFAWTVAHEAPFRMRFEEPRDRVISIRVWPVALPEGPPQDMAILLNDVVLMSYVLENRPQILSVAAPATAFRPAGEEDVLEFYLGRLHRPPGDPRSLAVAFDWIRVTDLGR